MKKYSSTTKANFRPSTTKRWQRGLLITFFLLIFGWLFPLATSFVSYIVLTPVVAVSSWYQNSEAVLPKYLRSRTALIEEIEELKRIQITDTGTQLSIKRLLEENMQLRSAYGSGTSDNRLVAKVIAQPNRLNYDLLQIDKGSEAGVVVGAPVFLGLDTVIGAVVHVTPYYSFVELVTTAGFEATAYIVGPNIFAPFEGVGGGVARVKVPQGIALREGNIVLLPSVSGGVYGEVVSLENIHTQPEQYGYVTPPVSLQSLLYVSIGTAVPDRQNDLKIDEDIQTAIRSYFKLDVYPSFSLPTSTGSTTADEVLVRDSL